MEIVGLNPPPVLVTRMDYLVGVIQRQICDQQCKNPSALARHVNAEHDLARDHRLFSTTTESLGRHGLVAVEHLVYSSLKLPSYANRPPPQFAKRSVQVPRSADGFAWLVFSTFFLPIRWTPSGSFIVEIQLDKFQQNIGCVRRQFPAYTKMGA